MANLRNIHNSTVITTTSRRYEAVYKDTDYEHDRWMGALPLECSHRMPELTWSYDVAVIDDGHILATGIACSGFYQSCSGSWKFELSLLKSTDAYYFSAVYQTPSSIRSLVDEKCEREFIGYPYGYDSTSNDRFVFVWTDGADEFLGRVFERLTGKIAGVARHLVRRDAAERARRHDDAVNVALNNLGVPERIKERLEANMIYKTPEIIKIPSIDSPTKIVYRLSIKENELLGVILDVTPVGFDVTSIDFTTEDAPNYSFECLATIDEALDKFLWIYERLVERFR